MSLRKRWPNEAENARVDSIAETHSIERHVKQMLDQLEGGKNVGSTELAIRLGRISLATMNIRTKLIDAGDRRFADDKSRPDSE